ncbi:hypothetical protein [Chryseobacterium aureum]|uniref:hypothetical protein n=1 Tax=Chryseobacterium aureum TaxID=2497456 RepID=UPI001E5AF9E0|nr:hypothetical protein [Chryseobacterium aureum]
MKNLFKIAVSIFAITSLTSCLAYTDGYGSNSGGYGYGDPYYNNGYYYAPSGYYGSGGYWGNDGYYYRNNVN